MPKYTQGAIRNAELTKSVYPGWISRFYIGQSTNEWVIQSLEALDAEVIVMREPEDWTSLFWRFLAAADPKVEVMLSRDCDCRLSFREKVAVGDWVYSNKGFHIMRDHAQHSAPILGGLWGAKKGELSDMDQLIAKWKKKNIRQNSQEFLRWKIYPRIHKNSMVHDDIYEKKPFPLPRIGQEYVGEPYDEYDKPDLMLRESLYDKAMWNADWVIANRWPIQPYNRVVKTWIKLKKIIS